MQVHYCIPKKDERPGHWSQCADCKRHDPALGMDCSRVTQQRRCKTCGAPVLGVSYCKGCDTDW